MEYSFHGESRGAWPGSVPKPSESMGRVVPDFATTFPCILEERAMIGVDLIGPVDNDGSRSYSLGVHDEVRVGPEGITANGRILAAVEIVQGVPLFIGGG